MGIAMMEPSLPIWMKKVMEADEWKQGSYDKYPILAKLYVK